MTHPGDADFPHDFLAPGVVINADPEGSSIADSILPAGVGLGVDGLVGAVAVVRDVVELRELPDQPTRILRRDHLVFLPLDDHQRHRTLELPAGVVGNGGARLDGRRAV